MEEEKDMADCDENARLRLRLGEGGLTDFEDQNNE